MLRENALNALYRKRLDPKEFNFDLLSMPSMYNYISEYDISQLYDIATSIKFASKVDKKLTAIKEILRPRGFVQLANGTNRMTFSYLEDKSFVLKVPYDKVALNNNPREFMHQHKLKPFVTKCFEVHPTGVVGTFERGMPITNRHEFASVADDVFEVLVTKIIGQYVLEDVGSKYFMNWVIRPGFGPILCDYPEVFELDGRKLFCNKPLIPGMKFPVCGGEIDYDSGFNTLQCTRCGKIYLAHDLEAAKQNHLISIEGDEEMRVKLFVGDDLILESTPTTDYVQKPITKTVNEEREMHPRIIFSDPTPEEAMYDQPKSVLTGRPLGQTMNAPADQSQSQMAENMNPGLDIKDVPEDLPPLTEAEEQTLAIVLQQMGVNITDLTIEEKRKIIEAASGLEESLKAQQEQTVEEDNSPYLDRYRCDCGKFKGKFYEGVECDECKSIVRYLNDNGIYRCSCGRLTGRSRLNEECAVCNTKVLLIEDQKPINTGSSDNNSKDPEQDINKETDKESQESKKLTSKFIPETQDSVINSY